jgi:Major capsid protein Gp23
MKRAKKRHYKVIPEFWKILTGEQNSADPTKVGYIGRNKSDSGFFYCPYIPIIKTRINGHMQNNNNR